MLQGFRRDDRILRSQRISELIRQPVRVTSTDTASSPAGTVKMKRTLITSCCDKADLMDIPEGVRLKTIVSQDSSAPDLYITRG